jgi:predicted O-linked N-acetylglucosamine transferase (SPINDLY family)
MLYVVERERIGERFRGLFAQRGIDPARLAFVSRQPRIDYLRQHHQIDIALDPFPYNGHMTSCDALWMGVPTVSLRGNTSVGRGGESLLAHVGLRDLVASTMESYITIAAKLAEDEDRIVELHRTLRKRMQSSPLMDGASFTRDVESLYRTMWTEFTSRA